MFKIKESQEKLTHAANTAGHANVVEIMRGGSHLAGILLGGVAPRKDFLLAEGSVFVKIDLRIDGEN